MVKKDGKLERYGVKSLFLTYNLFTVKNKDPKNFFHYFPK